MAINPHMSAAIAQIVIYVPMVPVSLYILVRNWRHNPRMAWYPALLLSLVRLIGGILIVVEQGNPSNRSVVIAAIVLLNLGLVPLLVAFSGLLRLVLEANFKGNRRAELFTKVVRYNIIIAVALLGTSGGLSGQPERADVQATLSKVAYIQFAVVFGIMTVLCAKLFMNRGLLRPGDDVYLGGLLVAVPAVGLRTAYGLLSVFEASGAALLTSMWSPLFGSAVAFVFMAMLPEYAAVCVYVYLGWHRLRTGGGWAPGGPDGLGGTPEAGEREGAELVGSWERRG